MDWCSFGGKDGRSRGTHVAHAGQPPGALTPNLNARTQWDLLDHHYRSCTVSGTALEQSLCNSQVMERDVEPDVEENMGSMWNRIAQDVREGTCGR